MKASDVMTSRVVAIAPDDQVPDIAQILLDRQISAVPVLDPQGRIVGIVSEGDLIRRAETGTERHRSWWLRAFCDSATFASDYVKANALKASDIMTRNVVSVTPDTPLGEVADILEKKRIKRVPVVQDGRLVGIVSRANIIQALVAAKSAAPPAATAVDDRQIRAKLLDKLESQPWWAGSIYTNVVVNDGVVHVWGVVNTEAERAALRVAAESIPGVKRVEDHRTAHLTAAGY